MATNDNRAMVEAAKAYYHNNTEFTANGAWSVQQWMSAFALEQIALAVAAERTRIADELGELRSNVVDVEFLQGRLDIFEEQLRAERDADDSEE